MHMMLKGMLLDEVTYRNERMKMNYKHKCVGLPSTFQRQRGSNSYRVVEGAERL